MRKIDAAEDHRRRLPLHLGHDRLAAIDAISADGSPEPALGFVFQEPTLLPWRTAAENVHLPLMLAGVDKQEARERVGEALALVGLAAFADQLSAADYPAA